MLKLHKEGIKPLFVVLLSLVAINFIVGYFFPFYYIPEIVMFVSLVFYGLVVHFFRNPDRNIHIDPYNVIAPCDGKVVVIEDVDEEEYFKGKRKQVSIFMSPLNVHVNRYPVSGKIMYAKYHPGKFLVAWHPKASTLNERTTVVVDGEKTGEVLYRQIAGAVARRIVMYAKPNAFAKQGADSGFIKFGSRVDLFLPVDMPINIKIDDIVKGGETIIASVASTK
jgi:phosphatidylserine decarboxylase